MAYFFLILLLTGGEYDSAAQFRMEAGVSFFSSPTWAEFDMTWNTPLALVEDQPLSVAVSSTHAEQ